MKRTSKTPDEPGISEVRRWRSKLWMQGGGSLKGVMDLLRENAAAREAAKKSPRIRKRSA